MSNFESTLARMKSLMTYGRELTESKSPSQSYTLEYHTIAADGKTYGIVKECNKYYIKQAESGKELMAESYNYIGGYMNKANNEYDSYNKALKNLELKLSSLNEAYEGNVNVETLDPFKREDLVIEGTEKMKNELARQRQIMYNAAMLIGESTDYAVKGDACYCKTNQPEAEDGKKGDEYLKDAKVVDQDKVEKTKGLEKKVGPFEVDPSKTPDQLKEGKKCPKCGCECCECGLNEELDTDFDDGLKPGLTSEIGDGDPFEEKPVNENLATDTDFDEGMPSNAEAGVGEADTDHNNDPFNKNVTEINEEEDMDVDDVDVEDADVEDVDLGDEDMDADVEDIDIETVDDDEDVDIDAEDIDDADDVETEYDAELDESDPEAVKAEIERLQAVLNDLEGGADDAETEYDVDFDSDFEDGVEFPEEGDFEDVDTFEDDELEECGNNCNMMEGKKSYMNSIVESVTRQMIKEDQLHDFGKHPGYRKKPMTLPVTGQDRNEHGRDWNDDSVHNEEPFGKQVGDGAPFDEIVKAVVKDVVSQLTTADKKKE